MNSNFEHLNIIRTKTNVVWLNIDAQENEHNALTINLLKELKEVISSLHGKGLKGLILSSNKREHFVTGTDLDTLINLNTEQKADIFTSLGNQLCRHLSNLDCTSIALINGHCSNAGLEIALSCDYRLCSDKAHLQFSYSDIKHGHYAGFGSISRLIKRKGLAPTLTLLSKDSFSALEALAADVIDYIVPMYKSHQAAEYLIAQNAEAHASTTKKNTLPLLLPSKIIAYFGVKSHLKTIQNESEINALKSIIETWKAFNVSPDASHDEAISAAILLLTSNTQNHLKLNKLYQSLDCKIKNISSKSQRIHIIGCGTMGRYLARRCAENGLSVSIYDTRQASLEKLLPELYAYLQTHYENSIEEQQRILDRLIIDINNNGLTHADIVIEAIPEDKHSKASLLHDIDQLSKPSALILTTTACFPLSEISKEMQMPQRLAVLNPYHPLFKSRVAEISFNEAFQHTEQLKSFVQDLQLKPIIIQSTAGYLGTRLLMAYLSEAMLIHQTGISAQAIDSQTANMKMRYKPFELIDTIGIPECLHVAEALSDRLNYDVPNILMQKNEQGLKGIDSGSGFYRYKKGEQQLPLFDKTLSAPSWKTKKLAIEKRLLEKIINEARTCLQEGVSTESEIIDLISIVITGFPIEKGGPLSYLAQLQTQQVLNTST